MSLKHHLKRNLAVIAAASFIGAVGIGGVVTAQADSTGGGSQTSIDSGDGDGEVPDAQEQGEQGQEADGETDDDATDVGPDADPNEPGHQDASDAGDGDGEVDDD